MSYVHCHNCDWSQDDFWDFSFSKYGYWFHWKYNPISCFMSYIFTKRGYWKPRRIEFDTCAAKEYGWKRSDPHSWWLIWWKFKRLKNTFKNQHWWTYESWENDPNRWICPKCKTKKLDVD